MDKIASSSRRSDSWNVEKGEVVLNDSVDISITVATDKEACIIAVGRGIKVVEPVLRDDGLTNFDGILKEANGIILARGNLGIELPHEKVFLFQKAAIYKCNMAGKAVVVTCVVDSMADNLRPTRAEAADVANAVLDGIYLQEQVAYH
ncbi:pyruvate kinase 2, cytosolic-like [Vigna radiata var. radiata]|uniref:pyruvate kinase n=1 Tax=Vigna radiata var. radiata TaxID=3916 RepID=A0A1S3TH11_VIGRR|nr:pyruvate kinase 2, cytosolic-like [Vigna radiata var. radiata]